MVDVLTVIAVVVGAFLLSMGRVVGCVEVQKHLLWSAILAPLSQIKFEEGLGDLLTAASVHRVLQAREGGLACQIRSTLGQRAAHPLEQRVFPQGVRVVLVLIATGYLGDTLADQRAQRVESFPLSLLRYVF
jgi:hypothetical protein